MLDDLGLDEYEFRVLFYMLYMRDSRARYPYKLEKISEACGISRNKVSTVIKSLIEKKVLGRERFYRQEYYYSIKVDPDKNFTGPGKKFFVPKWLHKSDLNPAEFRVFMHVVRRAQKNGYCIERLDKMASHCRMGRGSIQRALDRLIKKGYLKKKCKKHCPSEYAVTGRMRYRKKAKPKNEHPTVGKKTPQHPTVGKRTSHRWETNIPPLGSIRE